MLRPYVRSPVRAYRKMRGNLSTFASPGKIKNKKFA
jgi:hypothetical protein